MKNNTLVFIMAGLFFLVTISALPMVSGVYDAGTFKRGNTINLRLPCEYNGTFCSSSAVCNITLPYPDTSLMINNELMTVLGKGMPNYTLPDSSILGIYIGEYTCKEAGEKDTSTFKLEITTTGKEKINTGEGISLLISLVVMITVGIFLFLIAGKFEKNVGKVIFIIGSGLVFFITILYSLVILNQNFGGFSAFTEGFANFFFVIEIMGSVCLTFVILYLLLLAIKSWKIHRGFVDRD